MPNLSTFPAHIITLWNSATARKKQRDRVQRIRPRLLRSQIEDDPVPSTFPQLLRYNLLYHNAFKHVYITPDFRGDYASPTSLIKFTQLSEFLRSQAEVQNVADNSSLWLQIQPILTFVDFNAAEGKNPPGTPTIFLFFSGETHRTYFFFAFLKVKMRSKTYSAGELLRLRDACPVKEVVAHEIRAILREDPELIEMRLSKTVDTRLTRIPEEARESSSESEKAPLKRSTARQLDGTDSEWKYRGRTESEDTEPQPISAPTGLAAQKDEGFQRFYRAVVSPTHVRVTAGGRIVPNNRGSMSPSAKWAKDRASTEGNFVNPVPALNQQENNTFTVPPSPFGGFPGLYPAFPPGFNPSIPAAPHQYPLMPWHIGGGFAMPMAAMNQVPPNVPPTSKSKENSRSEKQSESGLSEKANVQNSLPSEPFDLSRPSPFHGQWMMPTGHPFYPYPMAAPTGFAAPPFPMPMMHPHAIAMQQSHRASSGNSGRSVAEEGLAQPTSLHGAPPVFAPPSHPPVSSIRPSEITRRHLDILRTRMKFLEDQLSYNKHQIDERAVENDVQMVRQYIRQFEKNLEAQVSIEESHFTKSPTKASENEHLAVNDAGFSNVSNSIDTKSQNGTTMLTAQERDALYKHSQDKVANRFGSGLNSTKSASAFANWKGSADSTGNVGQTRSQHQSTLPIGAAKAAPFQPRTECQATSEEPLKQHSDVRNQIGSASDPSHHFVEPLGRMKNSSPSRRNQATTPYLVGRLPIGAESELASDVDYNYGRPLTEDEQRARHMYWGKAPRHLQKGLPKFDGKDFFPPSPVKRLVSNRNTDSTSSTGELSQDDGDKFRQWRKEYSDPFHGLGQSGHLLTRNGPGFSTQSESLPRVEQGSTDETTVTTTHSMPPVMRVGRSLDEFNRASQDTAATSSESVVEKTSSDESEDDREIIFTGRKKMIRAGTHNEIWSSMLKKGHTSASAVPGSISSTTAQGVLPHYAGHATASLTPTVANKAASPRNASQKAAELVETKIPNSINHKRGENCPPRDGGMDEIL